MVYAAAQAEAESFRRALLEREGHICRLLLTYFFIVAMFLDVTCIFADIGLVVLLLQFFPFHH